MRKTLRELRLARGWSQQRLADEIKSHRQRISDLENGVAGAQSDELKGLVKVFGCAVEDVALARALAHGRPRVGARPLLHRFRVSSEYDPSYGYTAGCRLTAARETYPSLMAKVEHRLDEWPEYLEKAPSESCFGTLGEMLELRREAEFSSASPLEVGFDLWPVTERESTRQVGHCRVPALVTRDWLMLLQVTVRTPRRYTMDGLLVVLQPRRVFINVEWDGLGHNPAYDSRRQRDLGLVTLRMSEAKVLEDLGLTAHLQAMGYCRRASKS